MMGRGHTVAVSFAVVAVLTSVSAFLIARSPSEPASAQALSGEPVSRSATPHPQDHPASSHDEKQDLTPRQLPSASKLLDCTARGEPSNFVAYSLGRTFEGLSLSDQNRTCTDPEPISSDVARIEAQLPVEVRRPREARLNFVSYLYGDCRPPPGEGGCPLPLEIQTWPRCEREPSDYDIGHHNPLQAKLTMRGVPAHLYEGGLRLEVYTGESTVVVFGTDPARVLRAGRALVRAPRRPNDQVEDHAPSGSLALPTGPIACG